MGTKKILKNIQRVWKVTKKPSKKEYRTTIKIVSIGFLIIGLIGFIMEMIWLGVKAGIGLN
jgi:protein translocase SEC61 complex gamma subunit